MSDLAALFAGAGVTGYLHAVNLDTGASLGHRSDDPVVPASVFKVPVLVELFRQVDSGEIDPAGQLTVPVAGRAPGPTGLSVMLDPVTLSWRDLALWMIVVSDNAATDVLCDRVGLDRVNATMRALGLTGTEVTTDCRGLFATMIEDLGVSTLEEAVARTAPADLAALRCLRPRETMRTTPRDMTRLLQLIAEDRAASPVSCAAIRQILARQVWPHRLASGFPEDDTTTGGKTGTLVTVRNEIGLVTAPYGRFAVAVFTVAHAYRGKNPVADAVIGRAARFAVDALR